MIRIQDKHIAINAATRHLFAYGVILVILGMLAIIAPRVAGLAVQFMIGWLILFAGGTWTLYATQARTWGSGLWEALVGILAVIGGLSIIARPVMSLEVLTLVLAIYFIATGVLKLALSLELRPTHGWGWTLWSGVISIFLGVLVMRQWPSSGVWLVGTLVGIELIFGGFSLIRIGSATHTV
jgi:uncharacterized membrane protein HdeD (DUF308 family)